MEFYVLANTDEEECYFNIAESKDVHTLSSGCFLPSKDLAEQYIEDHLCSSFIALKIDVETVSSNGDFAWTREVVRQWDN